MCDDCVRLPGCEHGGCTNAFECNCVEGTYTDAKGDEQTGTLWEGAFCDKRMSSCRVNKI